MSTIHLHQTTTSTPEQYVAGLTDFGPGRSKLFGNSADECLKGLGAFMRAVTELFGPSRHGLRQRTGSMNWSSWIFCLNRPAAIGDRSLSPPRPVLQSG